MEYQAMKHQSEKQWKALQELEEPLIWIGMGTCGRAAGADLVNGAVRRTLKKMRLTGRILPVGCIGMCYLEPLMAVRKPGGPSVLYGNLTADRTGEILADALENGNGASKWAVCVMGDGPADGLPRFDELPMIKPQRRIALRHCGLIDPEEIAHYLALGGYGGLHKALQMTPEEVIGQVKASGLRGRGGAGFPTGMKWEFAHRAPGQTKYLICNADEGDPGAFMDRSLLEGDPHAVLEGMLIGAYAIGCAEGYIYIRAEYPLAIKRLEKALEQMRQHGLLGERIMGSPFSFQIRINEGAGAFVCGEETALMASIAGGRGMPRSRPPFPAIKGLWGKPTTINNVETYANVSAILSQGAAWFAGYGTEKSRGTKTFALAGKIARTGLIEVPMGITLREIIEDIGGGIPKGKTLKAVQTGGPSGGCIPAELVDLPVDYESLARVGSIMGSGGMVVMDEDTCMVDITRYFSAFTADESCGKCIPCRLGTRQTLEILNDITAGRSAPGDLAVLEEVNEAVHKGSLCGLGQTAPNPVRTTLRYFRQEYESHILERKCPAGVCKALFHYEIDGEICNGCGLCARKCPAGAVTGKKKSPHVIDQDRCTKCALCYESCKFQAVLVR
ncbi:MAG: NADH-quinone oxidoreductase subunit NuoF [Thermodesulfobacteriota bacterium]